MKHLFTILLAILSISPTFAQSFLLVEPYGDGDWNPYCAGGVVNDIAFTAGHCLADVAGQPIYVQDANGNTYQASYVTHRYEGNLDYGVIEGTFTSLIGTYRLDPDITQSISPGGDLLYIGNLGGLGVFRDSGEYYGQLGSVLGLPDVYVGDHLAELNVAKGSSGGLVFYYSVPIGILVAVAPTTVSPWGEVNLPPRLAIFKDLRLAYFDYTSSLQ